MRRLKTWAEPLEDTAKSALANALDAAETARTAPRPATHPRRPEPPVSKPSARLGGNKNPKLPQKAFRQPLLEILYESGGSAHVRELRAAVKKRMEPLLLPADRELVSTGDERWWNATCWERNALVKEGYLRADSPRGTWTLSNRGRAHVKGFRACEVVRPVRGAPARHSRRRRGRRLRPRPLGSSARRHMNYLVDTQVVNFAQKRRNLPI